MKQCQDIEVELSAIIDGESDPATAVTLLDHLAECSHCRSFFRELRAFQSVLDQAPQEIAARAEPFASDLPSAAEPKRRFRFRFAPGFAWGAAAGVVVALGLWAGGVFQTSPTNPAGLAGGNVTIRLEENRGSMSEERFVELVGEVLRADRRYRDQMYVVLDQIMDDEGSDESLVMDETGDTELDETRNNPRSISRHVLN